MTNKAVYKAKKSVVSNVFAPAIVGIIVAGAVSLMDFLIRDIFLFYLFNLNSLLLYFILPAAGLILSSVITQYLNPTKENRLTEDYIMAYHYQNKPLILSSLPWKMAATLVTIIGGGCVGLEGPSIYLGANIGETIQKRSPKNFHGIDPRSLMIAGASAGFAALFKAPLTAVIFVLEVPFKSKMSSRALLPSLISSSFSYLTAAFLTGHEPLFSIRASVNFELITLLFAPVIGIVCGLSSRLFVAVLNLLSNLGKRLFSKYFIIYALLCGIAIGLLGVATTLVFEKPLNYGPGYNAIRYLIENKISFSMIATIFVARLFSAPLTFSGGGTGGIFFPLAVMGVIVGSLFNVFVASPDVSLYPLIGMSAFVAAGYRTPLAAVTFAAETTGNPYVLIPAMIASVFAFAISGKKGVSEEQKD